MKIEPYNLHLYTFSSHASKIQINHSLSQYHRSGIFFLWLILIKKMMDYVLLLYLEVRMCGIGIIFSFYTNTHSTPNPKKNIKYLQQNNMGDPLYK